VWIRAYLDLLDKDEYLDLGAADRALLHAIWLATGRLGNGRLPAGVVSLRRRFRLRHVALDRLIQAPFIEIRASKGAKNPRTEQSREEENMQFEQLREPKVDAATRSAPVDQATEPGDEYDHAARRLLEACRAPAAGSERWKLLSLRAQGASVGSLESARERVLTKQGSMRNPFGLAVTVIRAECQLREVPA
jgi:hypothetical protein